MILLHINYYSKSSGTSVYESGRESEVWISGATVNSAVVGCTVVVVVGWLVGCSNSWLVGWLWMFMYSSVSVELS